MLGDPLALNKHLIIDRHQLRAVIPQQQRAPGAVVQTLNAVGAIPLQGQTIAVDIADCGQPAGAKMVKPRTVAGQRQNQFFRLITEKDRRPRQAVVNRRARDVGQGKAGAAVFVVDPDHAIAVEGQAMGQRMAPAEPQADVDLDRAAAVQAGELEGQHAIEHRVGQGQQFFAGDHRHRAAIGTGFGHAIGGIAVRVFRLVGRVVVWLVLLQHGVALGIPAQLHPALFHPGGDAPRGNGFVAVDVFNKGVDDAEQRLDQTLGDVEQLRCAVSQTQRQISDPRPRSDKRQHHADQHIDDQLHDHHRRHFSRLAGNLAGRQHVQPQARRPQQQAHRRFVTDQQLQLFHEIRSGLRQLNQLSRATAQTLGKLAGILENFREQTEAVPYPLDGRPTAGEHAVAGCDRHRL